MKLFHWLMITFITVGLGVICGLTIYSFFSDNEGVVSEHELEQQRHRQQQYNKTLVTTTTTTTTRIIKRKK